MLQFLSLFSLFIVAYSQNSYYDCGFTPGLGVEPLTCCKISKPFDKKNFPECFPDPAIYVTLPTVTTIATTTNSIADDDFRPFVNNKANLNGFRGYGDNGNGNGNGNGFRGNSNGYRGSNNGYRGNDNGYRGNNNGFSGNEYGLAANDNGFGGNDNGLRGNSNGFRGNTNSRRNNNDAGYNNNRQNSGNQFGDREREDEEHGSGEHGHGHSDSHEDKKHFGHWFGKHHHGWHGHHDWQGHRHRRQAVIQIPAKASVPNCAIECIFNQTNVLKNDVFDRTIALEVYSDYYPEIDIDLLTRTVDRCSKQLKNYQRTRLRRGRNQISRAQSSNKACHNGAGLFASCFNREVYRNCPVNLDSDDDDCISLRTYIDNCAPVRGFRDIGFDYYLDVDANGNIVPQAN